MPVSIYRKPAEVESQLPFDRTMFIDRTMPITRSAVGASCVRLPTSWTAFEPATERRAPFTPVRAPATALSLFGSLFGLFYTAVVVSQLVGMAQSGKRETPNRR